ncbi:hypothetical protein BC937DRAFT_87458 [Endogone sp. FLAS-F59071]|nr:hypothetical protein BC937DRAFT_87458 [Endogone sp. FLAS-F59071]|eukprot:RUS19444.1 hypothetical protein BC937DRAFT_87458 [Endogone sp. FLAS-F59071]
MADYFAHRFSKWDILEFLRECKLEPFERKIDLYVRRLEEISSQEKGNRQKRARELLARYRNGSDNKLARTWNDDRKSNDRSTGPAIHFHGSTVGIMNSGTINSETLRIRLPKRLSKNEEEGQSPLKMAQREETQADSTEVNDQATPDKLPLSDCTNVAVHDTRVSESSRAETRPLRDRTDDLTSKDKVKVCNEDDVPQDVEVIRVVTPGWVIQDGRNVGDIFTNYRETVGSSDKFAVLYIYDITENSPIRRVELSPDDESMWAAIDAEWNSKWMSFLPSAHAKAYLVSLQKSNAKDVRRVLMEPYTNEIYNTECHYDLEYIHSVVRAFITKIEQKVNPLLDDTNSEEFWQVHVYGRLIDELFFDMPEVQIVRGEKASRAVSYGKNALRQYGERKISASKLDAAVVTRDTWRVELVTLEAGRQDSVEGQSKKLSDQYKLAKTLKAQLDFIYKWLPESQKRRITNIEVFGILTSGLEGRVYAMDLPCSGVYRFGELFRFELPRQFDRYKLLVKGLARFLALKARVRNILGILQDIDETSTMEVSEDPDLLWSPNKKPRTQLTRPTQRSPTRTPSKRQSSVARSSPQATKSSIFAKHSK